jgi:epoxyqueuosine reductase
LEREFAQLAGLGWIGKNTLLLNKEHGSWFFLAALLTDVELEYDERTMPDEELRVAQGDWIFGCDVCQDVCPWNHRAPISDEPAFAPTADANPVDLAELFSLDDEAFRRRFRHTPLWRAKRRGILRNAAFALANHPSSEAQAALERGARDHEEQVRQASRWAIEQIRAVSNSQA